MTYRPTASDPATIHNSARTKLRTVKTEAGEKMLLNVSRLHIRWVDGDVAVRFTAQDIDVTPRERKPRLPRHRR